MTDEDKGYLQALSDLHAFLRLEADSLAIGEARWNRIRQRSAAAAPASRCFKPDLEMGS